MFHDPTGLFAIEWFKGRAVDVISFLETIAMDVSKGFEYMAKDIMKSAPSSGTIHFAGGGVARNVPNALASASLAKSNELTAMGAATKFSSGILKCGGYALIGVNYAVRVGNIVSSDSLRAEQKIVGVAEETARVASTITISHVGAKYVRPALTTCTKKVASKIGLGAKPASAVAYAAPLAGVVIGCVVVNQVADYAITQGQEIALNGRYNFDDIWAAAGRSGW
jgi:hypothetical protein